MSQKMIIDASHREETRVVLLSNNRVEDFDFESTDFRQIRGNIYLAKVTRVEPSLQAAFVEYGGNRHGFLAFSEIHPDYYQLPVADRKALIEELENLAQENQEGEDVTKSSSKQNKRSRSRKRKTSAKIIPINENEDENSGNKADGQSALEETEIAQCEDLATQNTANDEAAASKDAHREESSQPQTPSQEDDNSSITGDAPQAASSEEIEDTAKEPTPDSDQNDQAQSEPKTSPKSINNDVIYDDQDEEQNSVDLSDSETDEPAEPITKKNISKAESGNDPSPEAEMDQSENKEEASQEDKQTEKKPARRRTTRKPKSKDKTESPSTDEQESSSSDDDPAKNNEQDAVNSDAQQEQDENSAEESEEQVNSKRKTARRPRSRGRSRSKSPDNETSTQNMTHEHAEDSEVDDDEDEIETVEIVGKGDALEEIPVRHRLQDRYKIQDVIKRRQILLVQVAKEERGGKGAALTTYISLAGRYCVLMPNTARGGGISRKITNGSDRSRLREVAEGLNVPSGMGVIVRTAGASRSKLEIKRDYDYLMRLWNSVREDTLKSEAPCLIYEEGSLIKRSIRDIYSKEISEVLVSGENAYKEAKALMKLLMPSHAKNVKPYKGDSPIFTMLKVEQQLDALYSPKVPLPSGGYLIINPTEALVSVDVNSGRATKEHSIEETALQTNLEAAEEVARQMRLRDLAGLLVIDFIDMDEKRNNRAVEKKLKDSVINDRARIQIGRISHFGLLEMSRQRMRTGVLESSTDPCPSCLGTGLVRNSASVSLHLLRTLENLLIDKNVSEVTILSSSENILYLLNNKRTTIGEFEERFSMQVSCEMDMHMAPGLYHISLTDEEDRTENFEFNAMAEVEDDSFSENDQRRNRRKKRRRKNDHNDQNAQSPTQKSRVSDEPSDDNSKQPPSQQSQKQSDTNEEENNKDDQKSNRSKRKRRPRRGRGNNTAQSQNLNEETSQNIEEKDNAVQEEASSHTEASQDDPVKETQKETAKNDEAMEASNSDTKSEANTNTDNAPTQTVEETLSDTESIEAVKPIDYTAPEIETQQQNDEIIQEAPVDNRPKRQGWWQRKLGI